MPWDTINKLTALISEERMRLKKGLLARETENGITFVSHKSNNKFKGAVYGNETTSFIVKCLKHDTSESAIVKKMTKIYDADPDVILNDVRAVIAKLRELDLLEDDAAESAVPSSAMQFDFEEIADLGASSTNAHDTTPIEDIIARDGKLIWTTKGSSMRPLLKTGRDLVQISAVKSVYPDGMLKVNDVALYKIPESILPKELHKNYTPYILHRVIAVRDTHYIIRGDNNPGVETVPFDWVIGVMTGLTRKGKNVDLNGKKYKLYLSTWVAKYRLRMRLKLIKIKIYPAYKAIKNIFKK